MLRVRRRIFNGQLLNTPDRNFNFIFTTRGPLQEVRILILLFVYIPFPFVEPNQSIGHIIQTCPALFFVVDSWQVVSTPSVADWRSEASQDSEPWPQSDSEIN